MHSLDTVSNTPDANCETVSGKLLDKLRKKKTSRKTMNFPPKENIIFKTKLTSDTIAQRLFKICSGPHRTYDGQVTKSAFDIKRVITGQNSFLPKITGKVKSENEQTVIEIDMRINTGVTVFLWIWFIGTGLLGLFFLPIFPNPISFIPFVLFAFCFIMMVTLFNRESKKSKNDLQTLFEAEIVDVKEL